MAQPSGATSAELHRVSCAAPTACTAVGTWTRRPDAVLSSTEPGGEPLAERWDGRAWTPQDVPVPTGSRGSHLDGLACPAPTACTAVGATLDPDPTGNAEHAYATTWDGNRWTTQQVDEPAGATSTLLTALSCPSTTGCTAIGFTVTGPNLAALTETSNGTGWHQLTPATTNGPTAALTDISCAAPASCLGVGSTATDRHTRTAAELLNTAARTADTPLDAPGTQTSYFTAVSCSRPADCTAVGTALPSTTIAMAQHWDGHHWTQQPLPMPAAP
ncbi:hypothetical protein ABTY61_07090 [Kitasatospora sp. NPDC096128]|uniref:hypothetical protein n=1 Tax=Kitasatospora sp. NPDC096128 TaxID=3155547 RepID=UPI00331A935F